MRVAAGDEDEGDRAPKKRDHTVLMITHPMEPIQYQRAVGSILRHVLRREQTVEVAEELCAILDLQLPQR